MDNMFKMNNEFENLYEKSESEMSEIEKLTKQIADLIEKKKISFVFNGEPWYYRGRNDELTLIEILSVLPESVYFATDDYYFEFNFSRNQEQRIYYAYYASEEKHVDIAFQAEPDATVCCAKLLISLLTDYGESFK